MGGGGGGGGGGRSGNFLQKGRVGGSNHFLGTISILQKWGSGLRIPLGLPLTRMFVVTRFPPLFQIGLLRCEFVPLWACRVQHLRPYYCGVKPKQRGKAVISCHVWYLPLLMFSWLTALTFFIIISLHQQHLLETCEYNVVADRGSYLSTHC